MALPRRNTFNTYRDTVVTTPQEQLQLVRNSLSYNSDKAGRKTVYEYIHDSVNGITDLDTQQTALINLAVVTQEGIRPLDYSPTLEEQAKDARISQKELVARIQVPTLREEAAEERAELQTEYADRLNKQKRQKARDNKQRYAEFIMVMDELTSAPAISEKNALGAYYAIEESQVFFCGRTEPDADSSNWPPGIDFDERENIERTLADLAAQLIEKAPLGERSDLYARQAGLLRELSDKNNTLRKAYDALPDISAADKRVAVAIRVAEEAVKVDAAALDAKKIGVANTARRIEHDALDLAIDTTAHMPRTIKSFRNVPNTSRFAKERTHREEIDIDEPKFVEARKAITQFNTQRVKELIETPHTASAITQAATLWDRDRMHVYWAPLIEGLFQDVFVDDDKKHYAKMVSAKRLKKLMKNWPNFEHAAYAAGPDGHSIVATARSTRERLLLNARIVD